MRIDSGLLPRVLAAFDAQGIVPDLVVSSEVAVTLVVPAGRELGGIVAALGTELDVESMEGRGIVCVVGSGLARDPAVRGRVLAALSGLGPEMVALGGSATSVAAVVPDSRLREVVQELHRRFFEEGEAA
jgi:aspartokinase